MARLEKEKSANVPLGKWKGKCRNLLVEAATAVFLVFMCSTALIAQSSKQQENTKAQDGAWYVKALHPNGYILDVRALDRKGNVYEVKAVNDSCQTYIMDIQAYLGDEILPVKVLMDTQEQKSVSVIDDEGHTFQLRAVTPEGKFLPVRGISSSAYTVDIKAVTPEGRLLNIRAVSPDGKLRDVKGIKMYEKPLEMTLHGVEVHAHLVALPQL